MEDLKIKLSYDPEYFQDIYYTDGKGAVFTYKPTRNALIYFSVALLLTAITYLLSFEWPVISWLIVGGLIICLLVGIQTTIVLKRYYTWKRSVDAYIHSLSQYKSYVLLLTQGAIELSFDSTVTLDKWSTIVSAEIYSSHIILNKKEGSTYMFPAKAMRMDEFARLREFVMNKMKITDEQQ